MQDKNSRTISSDDTSLTKMTQLDYAIPAAKIAALSSGEFVGMVADNPDERIKLKMFHAEIQNDHEAIAKDIAEYRAIPDARQVSPEEIQENYKMIKKEVDRLVSSELAKLETTPSNARATGNNKKNTKKKKPASNQHDNPVSM